MPLLVLQGSGERKTLSPKRIGTILIQEWLWGFTPLLLFSTSKYEGEMKRIARGLMVQGSGLGKDVKRWKG